MASGAAVKGHQLALFDIKLLFLVYHPFMMTVATQGVALVLLFKRGFAKGNNLRHQLRPIPSEKGALKGGVPGRKPPATRTGTYSYGEFSFCSPDVFYVRLTLP